jgi:hypothetical protein
LVLLAQSLLSIASMGDSKVRLSIFSALRFSVYEA